MFKEYKDRLKQAGNTNQEAVISSSKRQAINSITKSATKSNILMGQKPDDMKDTVCIGSDVDTYKMRRFLFFPDTLVYKGDYIVENGLYYLITNLTFNEIYPQGFAEHCNETFDFVVGEEKIKTGVDKSGRPIYEIKKIIETYPCVLSNKVYSEADNSPVPLPDGAMIIKVPYFRDDKLIPDINRSISHHGDQFKIVNVNYDNVMKYRDGLEHGHLEVQLQREPVGTQ